MVAQSKAMRGKTAKLWTLSKKLGEVSQGKATQVMIEQENGIQQNSTRRSNARADDDAKYGGGVG